MTLTVLVQFGDISSSKINLCKSEAMPIGGVVEQDLVENFPFMCPDLDLLNKELRYLQM